MPNKLHQLPYDIFRGTLLILIAVLPFSRAVISISTGLLFLSAIFEFFLNRPRIDFKNGYFICLALLVFFCILDGFRAYSIFDWVKSIETKLPLILLPFSYLVFKSKLTNDYKQIISIVFCLTISLSTLASIFNYFLNFEEINRLVLQSRNVPIIGGMHHITYSVFCAFAIFVSTVLALKTGKKWLWILAGINFIGLHILTARTGLVGFYFSIFAYSSIYFFHHKLPKKYLIGGITLAIIIPLVAFFTLESLQNRVINTIADFKVVLNQEDANYQSMGMRVEASKTAFNIIKNHPLIGIGSSNIKKAMDAQYEQDNSNLFLENRILPHTQFIMEAAVHGISGLIILLVFFVLPFLKGFRKLPTLFKLLWTLIFFACIFECLFDRQHGIILIGLFWFLFNDYWPENDLTKPNTSLS